MSKMLSGALAGVMLITTVTCGVIMGPPPVQAQQYGGPPLVVLEEQERNLHILERVERQRQRIRDGVRTRQLTRSETNLLVDNLNWISKRYNKAKRDGWLTRDEESRLNWLLDQNSRMIYDSKHNRVWRLY